MIKYCTKEFRQADNKFYYMNCYSSKKTVRAFSSGKIHKINVREALPEEDTPYVGWLEHKKVRAKIVNLSVQLVQERLRE